MKLSVLIPTRNEADGIAASLKHLRDSAGGDFELILVDGGSTDETVQLAEPWADRVVRLDAPNRGRQMHTGAQAARGDFLFFLHADARPPADWRRSLEKRWEVPSTNQPAASVFSVSYGDDWKLELVAWGQNKRVDWRQIAYGDAGICTSARNYAATGGIPEIPLMEDVVFSKRLRALGPLVRLPEVIRPDPRRLQLEGPIRNSLHNAWLRLRFAAGAAPEALWHSYVTGRGRR